MTYYQDIVDTRLLSNLRELLSDAEREREKHFCFADDRLCYLVTRAMVRTVLSRYAPISPVNWIFSANTYGRPEVANCDIDATDLCFNISHARGLIALAVSRRCALGIDVENLQTRQASIDLAERHFSPVEIADLATVPAEQRQDRFFEYWTFKESYIKARGMGLSLPLDRFSFHYPRECTVQITIDQKLGDDGNRWSFWQFRPTQEHLLAVCAERLDNEAPVLSIRKIVPTVADEVVEIPLLRSSEMRSEH
ncbi:4'-phosphopantetheinyl transferase family protein [Noviherbaspirillum cavernae]|uniref:4'-phosphopantetheinyl transferase family protein n=1 Tax=Noviherbaspirillum cavernae TaxID=2320862 RepID=UPI001314F026|nr:4'-phosphopantetheinyl transferase superfamily protein [Noviherbaspirillum cavernae]